VPDFRQTLYDHYVSRFTGKESQLRADSLLSYLTWSEYKFAPLLEGLEPDSTILELGCGPGYMLEFLKRCGFRQVKGIDVSREQVQLARSRGSNAEVTDVFEYLNGRHEAIDAIIALDFIEHFHKEELIALMPLVLESLKKDGRLILQTPNGEGLFPRQIIYGDLTHLTILTPSSLQQLLEEVGFHDFRFYETGPVPKNMMGKLRLLLWQMIKFAANSVRKIEAGTSQAIWTDNMICCCSKPKPFCK